MDEHRAAGVSDQDEIAIAAAPPGQHAESAEQLAADSEPAESLEGDLDELVEVANQRDEYLALAQRTQADFENYRKRIAREAGAAETRGLAKLARELLPALDNLDRALSALGDLDAVVADGLRLVQRDLLGALERCGVESFGAAGEQFDPGQHEAVAQQPFEGFAPGEIVEIYQSGYRLAGAVIRPARVLVAG
jgi:molecular chaperone GrpE